jgi:hypothetical protein
MKKLTGIEPNKLVEYEENHREQHSFNPITSIIGILMVIAFLLIVLKVGYEIMQRLIY